MNRRNYQKELEQVLRMHEGGKKLPTLLLHSCCAPCSSYVLEYLSQYFEITVFYYNPNIFPESEYEARVHEIKRLIRENEGDYQNQVTFIEGDYDPRTFFTMAKGMEELPERGKRCYDCYELRMREAAQVASQMQMDYFTTTLSISPHKNADWINEIGERLAKEYGVSHLPSDFKKKNGYKRSIELSEQFGLYRQDYCGCIYSKQARDRDRNER